MSPRSTTTTTGRPRSWPPRCNVACPGTAPSASPGPSAQARALALTCQCDRCTLDCGPVNVGGRVMFMCSSRRSGSDAPAELPRAAVRSVVDRAMRASDRDREAVVALLGEHTAAGRLTLAEFEERVGE